jgi:hypothetical protein
VHVIVMGPIDGPCMTRILMLIQHWVNLNWPNFHYQQEVSSTLSCHFVVPRQGWNAKRSPLY